jgi:hypothetical protein
MTTRKPFFALEHTKDTSENDVEDMCELLELICKRYHFRWSQAMWKEEGMQRTEAKKE